MRQPKPAGTITGCAAIARYCYGAATPKLIRRVRHQIDNHGLPVAKKGQVINTFPDWLDRWLRGVPNPKGRSIEL